MGLTIGFGIIMVYGMRGGDDVTMTLALVFSPSAGDVISAAEVIMTSGDSFGGGPCPGEQNTLRRYYGTDERRSTRFYRRSSRACLALEACWLTPCWEKAGAGVSGRFSTARGGGGRRYLSNPT